MGFESLYRLVQTSAVYFLGAAGITFLTGPGQFLLQIALMVAFAAVLYVGKKAHSRAVVDTTIDTAVGAGVQAGRVKTSYVSASFIN